MHVTHGNDAWTEKTLRQKSNGFLVPYVSRPLWGLHPFPSVLSPFLVFPKTLLGSVVLLTVNKLRFLLPLLPSWSESWVSSFFSSLFKFCFFSHWPTMWHWFHLLHREIRQFCALLPTHHDKYKKTFAAMQFYLSAGHYLPYAGKTQLFYNQNVTNYTPWSPSPVLPIPPPTQQPQVSSLYLWVYFWFLSLFIYFFISHMSEILWYFSFSVSSHFT